MNKDVCRALAVVVIVVLGNAAACFAPPPPPATLLNGTLGIAGGGLTASAGSAWDAMSTQIMWDIDWHDDVQKWKYDYTLSVADDPEVSHFILQVSDAFTLPGDISDLEGPMYGDDDPTTYSSAQGNSNPDIPGSIYGVKFGDGTTQYSLSFYSPRNPVWGDFYAKGGNIAVWNTGFTVEPDNEVNHIGVPDTTTIIPAPGAALLAGVGMMGIGWLRRRRIV